MHRKNILFISLSILLVSLCLISISYALTKIVDPEFIRVNVSSGGQQALSPGGYGTSSGSFMPSMSEDGRYVAFESYASNLVNNDNNSESDVFVRDRNAEATEVVSVSTSGVLGNDASYNPSISADGRYVAFRSYATNLITNDNNSVPDIFVRDLTVGATEAVSVSNSGISGNDASYSPSISADGRFVAFRSYASNLVDNDNNFVTDIFVRDRTAGATEVVSVSTSGELGNNYSYSPSISADGRYVAFRSSSSNLVSNDNNSASDIFVRDRTTAATEVVSVSTSGVFGNNYSYSPSISADGRYVAFESYASNLVNNDNNSASDIFVRDRTAETTEVISVNSSGVFGNDGSYSPSISADGRYVAFGSYAGNLVEGDNNNRSDVFVFDRKSSQTVCLTCSASAVSSYDFDFDKISVNAKGEVAFESTSAGLVINDTNLESDIFVSSPVFVDYEAPIQPPSGSSIIPEIILLLNSSKK